MNTQSPESKVTIDELAVMINKGFMGQKKEFDEKINHLAVRVDEGFKEVSKGFEDQRKEFDQKLDDFALMVNQGFKEVHTDMNKGFREVREEMATKDDIYRLEKKIDGLENTVLRDHAPRLRRAEGKLGIA